MTISLRPAVLLSALLCVGLMIVGLWVRPIFPVDETRYLTVAWEMHQSGNWILPTLNGEAYHHKPPVLFWIINILWFIFGVSQQAAMVIPFGAGFAVLCLTARLSTRFFPEEKNAPLMTVAVLGGLLPFVLYSNLIMFDLLLTVAVLLGVTAIWDYFKTQKMQHVYLFAAAITLGLLIKGPAVLLHMAPILLGVRYWMGVNAPPIRKWLPRFLLGLALGIGVALCWAIPAALEGGQDFAEKIFYGQTTGRMVNAFDHKRPLLWYFMFVPLFVLPWACSPALWKGLKATWGSSHPQIQENKRLLILWLASVFVAFSLISGKQVHYLLPLLPPLALLFTAGFLHIGDHLRKRDIFPMLIGANILSLLPIGLHVFAADLAMLAPRSIHMEEAFRNMQILPAAIIGATIFILGFFGARRKKIFALVAMSVTMVLLTGGMQIAAHAGLYQNYDLQEFGAEIAKYNNKPLAFAGNYHGEFGFLGRLNEPLDEIEINDMSTWISNHPQGLIILYTREPEKFANFETVMSVPYRLTNHFLLLKAK